MLVQFSHESLKNWPKVSRSLAVCVSMLELAESGILFEGFNATFARGHMESIRDNEGPERILAFIRFLVRLNEHAEKVTLVRNQIGPVSARAVSTARIGEVIDHIVENYANDFSAAQAAEMAGMSLSAFSRHFSHATGHNFVEFVNRVRVGQACGLLYSSDDQVTSICYSRWL